MKTPHPGLKFMFQGDRIAFCRSLVHGGVQIVLDGKDHSGDANRCVRLDGTSDGTYEVLTGYDADSDTFTSGIKKIPSKQVEDVAAFDIGLKFLRDLESRTGLNAEMLYPMLT